MIAVNPLIPCWHCYGHTTRTSSLEDSNAVAFTCERRPLEGCSRCIYVVHPLVLRIGSARFLAFHDMALGGV